MPIEPMIEWQILNADGKVVREGKAVTFAEARKASGPLVNDQRLRIHEPGYTNAVIERDGRTRFGADQRQRRLQ